ncbi:UNVERIFIED_CONTAM: Reticulon-like protein B9 [Sesamum angustifolium]|uniref:Reticulon-like protein n=1 Tax=Sesamum angustifolium TaxID=2727405 RepID=A0AAW2RMW0_9LAMI
MPIFSSSESDDFLASPKRLFGSEKPLHALLGGGKAADILLWRKKNLSAAILIGSTIIWFLFEVLEYNFVTLLCHTSMILMLALLVWSIGADLVDLNRLDPQAITIPESTFRWLFAKANRILLRFYDVSSGKDLKTFILGDRIPLDPVRSWRLLQLLEPVIHQFCLLDDYTGLIRTVSRSGGLSCEQRKQGHEETIQGN